VTDAEFDALVSAGPIVDNASDRLWGPNGEYDGPRCPCGTAVEDDGDSCDWCTAVAL
jgi:hypothetical protein